VNASQLHSPAESISRLNDEGNGLYSARTDPDFWNQIGPFGGWLAAVSMHAMRQRLTSEFLPRSFGCTFIEYRLTAGAAFGGEAPSKSAGYVRLKSPKDRLEPEDLLLLADSWFHALWTQTNGPVPATTVTMSAVFHGSEAIQIPPDGFLQMHVSSSIIQNGYADETAELWIPGGALLLKAQQLLWLKFDRAHQILDERR
jgi:hypothetical protein